MINIMLFQAIVIVSILPTLYLNSEVENTDCLDDARFAIKVLSCNCGCTCKFSLAMYLVSTKLARGRLKN